MVSLGREGIGKSGLGRPASACGVRLVLEVVYRGHRWLLLGARKNGDTVRRKKYVLHLFSIGQVTMGPPRKCQDLLCTLMVHDDMDLFPLSVHSLPRLYTVGRPDGWLDTRFLHDPVEQCVL